MEKDDTLPESILSSSEIVGIDDNSLIHSDVIHITDIINAAVVGDSKKD